MPALPLTRSAITAISSALLAGVSLAATAQAASNSIRLLPLPRPHTAHVELAQSTVSPDQPRLPEGLENRLRSGLLSLEQRLYPEARRGSAIFNPSARLSVAEESVPSTQVPATTSAYDGALENGTSMHMDLGPTGTPLQLKMSRTTAAGANAVATASTIGSASDPATLADDFLAEYREYLRSDDPSSEFRAVRQTDDRDGTVMRYEQTYRALRVWPSELLLHVSSAGHVEVLEGRFIPTPNTVDIVPTLSVAQAQMLAAAAVPTSTSTTISVRESELIVYAPSDGQARLAWKCRIGMGIRHLWTVVIDATDGTVLAAFNEVTDEHVVGSGLDLSGTNRPLNVFSQNNRFFMVDTSKPSFDAQRSRPPNPDTTRGAIVILDAANRPPSNDPTTLGDPTQVTANAAAGPWLPDAVSAAFTLSETYDFYQRCLDRNSLDGKGGTILGIVRLGRNFENAFWSSDLNLMAFGDGLPFAGAIDVVGHELTHGVTSNEANLVYRDQPGALNESFSDIFGELVEAASEAGANRCAGTVAPDWLVGRKGLGETLRNLKDPSSIRVTGSLRYPEKMSEFVAGRALDAFVGRDNGGVHINSSIPNHAFYLLAEGQRNAIGTVKASQIFYRALTRHLTANAQFVDARLACLQSAEELFGANSAEQQAVAQAFDAVEIFGTDAVTNRIPTPTSQTQDSALFVRASLFGDRQLWRRDPNLGDAATGRQFTQDPAGIVAARPSITADGKLVLFVNGENDVCFAATEDGSGDARCIGSDAIHSVAISGDGTFIAYILEAAPGVGDKVIQVLDLSRRNSRARAYRLVAPATESNRVASIAEADKMVFTSNNRFLLYDARNELTVSNSAALNSWSIYALDLQTGTSLIVVPPALDADVGNPALAHTRDDLIAFEVIDHTSAQSTVRVGNFQTGEIGELPASTDSGVRLPTFNGDDTHVVYEKPDPGVPTGSSLFDQALAENQLGPSAAPPTSFLSDAGLPVIYRVGDFAQITVKRVGRGLGSVRTDVVGIDCGDDCTARYPVGTHVKLTATAEPGSVFRGWSGGQCSGTAECTVNAIANRQITARANFARLPNRTLRVIRRGIRTGDFRGDGSVVSAPAGIDCPGNCRGVFSQGTAVTLTATPAANSRFLEWTGACANTTGPVCTVDLTRGRTTTAVFAPAL